MSGNGRGGTAAEGPGSDPLPKLSNQVARTSKDHRLTENAHLCVARGGEEPE